MEGARQEGRAGRRVRCGSGDRKDVAVTGNGVLQRFGARAAALVALGTFAGAAAAVEAPPKGVDSPFDRLQFEWVSAKRDPFEYRPLQERKVTEPKHVTITPDPTKRGKNGPKERPIPPGLEHIARGAAKAELLLAAREHSKAAKQAQDTLNRIDARRDQGGKFTERLTRLRDTALRLEERAGIEKAFRELPISVEGIVWAPGKAVALINGKVMRPGQTVEGVTIGEIRRGEVIFVLKKGVRVRKRPLGAGAE